MTLHLYKDININSHSAYYRHSFIIKYIWPANMSLHVQLYCRRSYFLINKLSYSQEFGFFPFLSFIYCYYFIVVVSVGRGGMHMCHQRTEDSFIGLVPFYQLTWNSGIEIKSWVLLSMTLYLLSCFTSPWSLVSNTIFQLRQSRVIGKTVTSKIKDTMKQDEPEASWQRRRKYLTNSRRT